MLVSPLFIGALSIARKSVGVYEEEVTEIYPDTDAQAIGWRQTLDALPGLAYAVQPNGQVEFVNRFFYEYTGLEGGAFEADNWRSAIHPDDLLESEIAFANALSSGRAFRIRQRIRSGSGEYRLYDSITSPYRNASGDIILWFGVATDVEDQTLAATLLAESEQRLRTFLETVPQVVWTADATGWIDWYNPHWYAFTGQTHEEAAGWGWQDAHHPEDFAEVMRRWPHSIATGEPFEMEFRLRRHDGIFRWMLTRIVPLRDDAGNVLRWYGSNTDIDDQKRAQQRSTRVAKLVQDALLPVKLPIGEQYFFDAVYEPAESDTRVGGDWYDAVALPDGRVLFSIGDVTGHGVEAAAHAARLRQIILFAALEEADPARVLGRLNAFVLTNGLEVATAAIAIYDPPNMTVTYALAGHPPPVVAHPHGSAIMGMADGVPLGVVAEFSTAKHVVRLTYGSVFVFYTDGITEQGRDLFAAERALREAAMKVAANPRDPQPAKALRDAALAGAKAEDDTAVIVLRATRIAHSESASVVGLARTWRFHSSHALSARNVRRELTQYLRSNAMEPNAVNEAELVVGEILSNAVRHAPGMVEIEIDWTREKPRIRVCDSGTGLVKSEVSWPKDPLSETGRGIALVYALASDIVVEQIAGSGSMISCTLPIERHLEL